MYRTLLLSFLLVAAVVQGDFNSARAEKGLEPLRRIVQLDMLSGQIVFYQARNIEISHDVPERSYKLALQVDTLSWIVIRSGVPYTKWRAYELLARYPSDWTDSQISHIFDSSPTHAEVLYNLRAVWYGFVSQRAGANTYLVVYVVVAQEGVDAEQLRRLSF